jgi:hypothetical protein
LGETLPTDISFEPLPLVIGVTGHRDLREDDIPLLTKELEAIFDRLDRDYANQPSAFDWLRRLLPGAVDKRSGATPMIVLSALAEGADQLVAQLARDRGLWVIAPLPLPEEEYRRDFEVDPIRPDALEKFDKWIAPQPGVHKLFVGWEEGVNRENVRGPEKRKLQYRRAGAFIARHCDVLIALWDEMDGAATGGTAEIVDFKRHGIPVDVSGSGRASVDAPEIGPVIHIVTPRAATTPTAEAVKVHRWGAKTLLQALSDAARNWSDPANKDIRAALERDYELWKFVRASIRQTREFNRAAAALLQSLDGRDKLKKSLSYLFEVDEKYLFEVDETKPETGAMSRRAREAVGPYCDLYAVADNLAQRWQRIFMRDWFWLFLIGLFVFGSFEAYSHLAPIIGHEWDMPRLGGILERILLFGFISAFIVLIIWAVFAIWRQHQGRFLDYRALAEALRVAVFWRLAGIEHMVDAYPIKMPQELAWVKTCLLGQELLDKAAPARVAAPPWRNRSDYAWICDTWVRGQATWFDKARERHLGHAGWRERWSAWILFAIAVLAAALLLVELNVAGNAAYEPISKWLSRGRWAHDLFLFSINILPVVAAFFVGYSEKLAFNAQARRYDRMRTVFNQALRVLPRALAQGRLDLVRGVLRELGAETMRDNAEWVSTYRERPITLPQ